MEKDGVFLFDLNTPYKHREILADNVFDLEGPDATCCWTNHYDEQEQAVSIRIGIHYLDTDERFEENFKEYTYPLDYVEEVLQRYGFRVERYVMEKRLARLQRRARGILSRQSNNIHKWRNDSYGKYDSRHFGEWRRDLLRS